MHASNAKSERRRHRRYPVNGTLALDSENASYLGIPTDLSLGGLLFRADPVPPAGTQGTLRLQVKGFDQEIPVEARIVRTYGSVAAAIFVLGSTALMRCIEWLVEQERDLVRSSNLPPSILTKQAKAGRA